MDMAKRMAALLLALLLLTTGTANAGGVYYEIFPSSYRDTNGDGVGDLAGVTASAEYLQALGVNGIWLTPFFSGVSYHKYDVVDYQSVDSTLGTLADFDALAEAYHARGIRVMLDLVINHTSNEHPWFQSAVRSLTIEPCANGSCEGGVPCRAHNPYVSYYHFKPMEHASNGWQTLGNGWGYECVFGEHMPDLALENECVRREIENIVDFWLVHGADDFRLDAVIHYTGSVSGNAEVLRWITDYIHARREDAFVVAEAWTSAAQFPSYWESGVDALFNFPFAGPEGRTAKTLVGRGKANSAYAYANALTSWQATLAENHAQDAPFGSNHDIGRIAGFMRKDEAKIKLYACLNLTMTGTAFVYYGEELGMSGAGKDENKRAPMYWSEDATAPGMTKGPADMEPQKHAFGSLEAQEADAESIYAFYQRLLSLRAAHPAISEGAAEVIDLAGELDAFVLRKACTEETIYLVYNLSADRDICVTLPEAVTQTDFLPASRASASPEANGTALTVPPQSLTVLVPAQ